jgi:hypothetical protein
VFVGAFLLYFMVYRVRHFSLPLGWDTPWYVWRADFVAHVGLGPLDTGARPGHELLSAILGSLTGLSQLRLQVVVPFVLVGTFALAMGAMVAEGLGSGEAWRWAVGAGVTAAVIGTTRLVGENVANLMEVLLVVVGLLLLLRFLRVGRGFVGAVLMLVAAGLSHWLFLAVFGVVMAVWFLLALAVLRRERAAGVPLHRTEAGAVGLAGAITGLAMAVVIYPVLHSALRTLELHETKARYLPKLREDLSAMVAPAMGAVAGVGAVALAAEERPAGPSGRRPFLRLMSAWTAVALGGLVVSIVTLAVPPHRFLTLFLVGPGVVLAAAAVWTVAGAVARRVGRPAGVVLGIAAVAALGVPSVLWWYGPADLRGPEQWFDATAFQQARSTAPYLDRLPPTQPVVFLVGPLGSSGSVSVALKERTIRAALPPSFQERTYVVADEPADLLAGRFTREPNPDVNAHNLPYWQAARPALAGGAPVLVLQELGPKEFAAATERLSAPVIAPGTALLRGPRPAGPLPAVPPLRPVPTSELGLLDALGLVVLLTAAGWGWARWFLGRDARPLLVVSVAPAVGAGILALAGLVVAKAGLVLGGAAGVGTFAVVAVAGAALGVGLSGRVSARLSARGGPPATS